MGESEKSPTPAPTVHLKIEIAVTVRRGISKRSHEKLGDCQQSTNQEVTKETPTKHSYLSQSRLSDTDYIITQRIKLQNTILLVET